MGLETGEFLNDLDQTNPVTATDPVSEGSNHLRLLKKVLQQTFPNYDEAVTTSPAELNLVPATKIIADNNATQIGLNVTAIGDNATQIGVNIGDISAIYANAAFKAMNETIDGAWIFFTAPLLANNIELLGRNFENSSSYSLVKVDASNVVQYGNNFFNGVVNSAASLDIKINNNSVLQAVTGNLGSMLIKDRAGIQKKTGFRNPGTRIITSGAVTLLQDDEGQIVKLQGTAGDVTVPVLQQYTTITIKTVVATNLLQSGVTIRWMKGDGTFPQGNATIAAGSVVTLHYEASTVVEIWGNGIS